MDFEEPAEWRATTTARTMCVNTRKLKMVRDAHFDRRRLSDR
jgi:hypothetical protein